MRIAGVFLLFSAALSWPGLLQPGRAAGLRQPASIRATVDSLFNTQRFNGSAISPDGKMVAWVEALKNPDRTPSANSAIFLGELPDARKPKRITAGDGSVAAAEHSVVWAPDSRQLAFLSDYGESGQQQLYVAGVNGAPARKLTSLNGFLAAPRFSPDGKEIAFLFTENAPRAAGPLQPATPEVGVVDQKIYEQRLAILDVASGKMRTVTPPDIYVYEYDWAPGGHNLAYTAARGEGDNNWWIAKLYRVNAASSEVSMVCDPPAQIADPRWSPDGKSIAFISGLMSDEGATGGDVYLVPAAGGSAENLTPGRKSSPDGIAWIQSSGKLLLNEHVDGGAAISLLDAATRQSEVLWRGDESIAFGGVAEDGRTSAVIRSSWAHPPEVWAGPLGDWRQITHANKGLKPRWGAARKVEWSNGGFSVEGWLLYPVHFDAGKKYPMVVSIHGGPASEKSPSWPRPGFDLSALASQGYFVFFPNPRGSYGEGEAFTKANVKDFGYGDLADILAGVDQVLKTVPVDAARVGIGGWSYGGYMTMWAVTQTHRFKAAVAGAGLSNWQSYYGENLIDQWMIPYFGASVYDDPAVYAKSSPINFIKNVRTPTLVVVGDRDAECPMPQSREFWHALKDLRVKTEFVIYPDEGHSFRTPAHIEDVMERTIAWYRQNL